MSSSVIIVTIIPVKFIVNQCLNVLRGICNLLFHFVRQKVAFHELVLATDLAVELHPPTELRLHTLHDTIYTGDISNKHRSQRVTTLTPHDRQYTGDVTNKHCTQGVTTLTLHDRRYTGHMTN